MRIDTGSSDGSSTSTLERRGSATGAAGSAEAAGSVPRKRAASDGPDTVPAAKRPAPGRPPTPLALPLQHPCACLHACVCMLECLCVCKCLAPLSLYGY
jgi:hypothetical protein